MPARLWMTEACHGGVVDLQKSSHSVWHHCYRGARLQTCKPAAYVLFSPRCTAHSFRNMTSGPGAMPPVVAASEARLTPMSPLRWLISGGCLFRTPSPTLPAKPCSHQREAWPAFASPLRVSPLSRTYTCPHSSPSQAKVTELAVAALGMTEWARPPQACPVLQTLQTHTH